MKKHLCLFACVILFVGCNFPKVASVVNAQYEMDIDPSKSKVLDFSETTDFVKYVPLETTEESLIKHVEKMFISDSLVIVFDDMLGEIFLFNQEGKYRGKCGKKGEGPGEHIVFNDLFFDKNAELIYAHEAMKRVMYIYNLSGDLIREIPTNHIWFRSFCKVNDGYWIYTGYNNESTGNCLLKVNDDFAVVGGWLPQKEFFRTAIHSTFIQKEEEQYFISPYSNIIYRIYNDSIAPYVKIGFGNKTLPYEKMVVMSENEYNGLVENGGYWGDLGNFLFCRNRLYFTFSEIAEHAVQYSACYDTASNQANVYGSYSPYHKKNFKFADVTFMLPKATFGNQLVFLVYPYDLQEKDMRILQEDAKYRMDLDSNPILFFVE